MDYFLPDNTNSIHLVTYLERILMSTRPKEIAVSIQHPLLDHIRKSYPILHLQGTLIKSKEVYCDIQPNIAQHLYLNCYFESKNCKSVSNCFKKTAIAYRCQHIIQITSELLEHFSLLKLSVSVKGRSSNCLLQQGESHQEDRITARRLSGSNVITNINPEAIKSI